MDMQQMTPRQRRQEKRAREQHALAALAPNHVDTSMGYKGCVDILRRVSPCHMGGYHGSSHHRCNAPAIPTGLNERFVGFELELIPHIAGRIKGPGGSLYGISQFFGHMQTLASKAAPGYWSKVESDSTIYGGAEFISGYGPIAVHHKAMMAVLCDPVIARLGSAVNYSQQFQHDAERLELLKCGQRDCCVCSENPVPRGVSEAAKLGISSDRTSAGMHVHIHATDRLGRRLSASDRMTLGEVMADVLTDLRESRQSTTSAVMSDKAAAAVKLWDKLVGREPTDFCKEGCGGHYESVNVDADRTPTIEIRSFRATVNPRLFFARLEFALALYEYGLDACLTGWGGAYFGQFVHWLDEHAASQGLAVVLPNLMAVLAEHQYPTEELGDQTPDAMPWLADPEARKYAEAVGEGQPGVDPEDEEDGWMEDEDDDPEPEEDDDDDDDDDGEDDPEELISEEAAQIILTSDAGAPLPRFIPWSSDFVEAIAVPSIPSIDPPLGSQ